MVSRAISSSIRERPSSRSGSVSVATHALFAASGMRSRCRSLVFTSREHIIALEPRGKGLLGITLRYQYEVRNKAEYFSDIGAGTGPVLDQELLAKSLRQPLAHEARNDVRSPARRKADDNAHRPNRIVDRACAPRENRQHGGACSQTQKFTAGTFHGALQTGCPCRLLLHCTHREGSFATSRSPGVSSAPAGQRNLINVRFAPKATEVLRLPQS